VAGGNFNTANQVNATVGGGGSNSATGQYSTVPGGAYGLAQGDYSFAAGRHAKALDQGCFVWADSTDTDFACNADNAFIARASGGVIFFTNAITTTGVIASAGSGSWSTYSDRNVKANFAPVDGQAILERLANMPVSSWNYKAQGPAIRHIGPMAQDFATAFGVGENDVTISTVDAQGVALAAIQGLYAQVKDRDATIAEQQREIAALYDRMAQVESLRGELAALKDAIAGLTTTGAVLAVRKD
jgi:hypothetical protein